MEINGQSLFADPSELEKDVPLKVEEKRGLTPVLPESVTSSVNVKLDDSIVEVKFCTGGRLCAPPVLHFRDYTMLASQELASIDDNYLPSLVRALNSMIVENFDCGRLHIEEVKEVLLNIYGKWWGDKLTGYKYLINPDLEDEEKLLSSENISIADIPLSSLAESIVPLDPEIKEPINVKSHGVTARFIYPRVQNTIVTDELLKVKFAIQEQQFFKLTQLLKYNENQTDPDKMKEISVQELEDYEQYLAEREKWRIIYLRAHELCAVDDDVFETFEQRLEALTAKNSKVTIKHWQKYNNFLEGKGKFGLKNEAEFYSDILNQKVRRPFQFYAWNFIPTDSMEFNRNVDDEIYFG